MPQTTGMVLSDMLHAIEGIERAVRGRQAEDMDKDWLLKHGLQRGIEIISEASRRIPNELKSLRPEVPWTDIAGIGSVLRHEYHRISDRALWNTATLDLPKLKEAVLAISREIHR